jgi:O-antigen/teichoic acid export membrane protein
VTFSNQVHSPTEPDAGVVSPREPSPDVGLRVVGRSVFWNWAGILIASLVQFVTLPVMIHSLGNGYYGIWVLIYTFVGYFSFFDFGIGTSILRFASRLDGAEDVATLHRITAAALHLSIVVALSVVAITASIAYFVPEFLNIPPASVPLARTLVLLMGVSVAIMFPARALGSCLQGLQRFDLYNAGYIATNIIRGACIIAALYMGFGILTVGIITVLTALFSLAFYLAAIQFLDRNFFTGWMVISFRHMRELVAFSSYVFVMSIGDYLRFQLDSVVISRYLSVALVTPFSVAATLMTFFMNALGSITSPLMSEQARLDGAGLYAASREFFLHGTKVTASFALLGGVLLISNGKLLLQVWLGEELVGAYPVLVILTAAYVIDLGQGPSINLLRSRGRHQAMAYWTVLEGIANLVLSIVLCRRMGIVGVALGTAIPMLVTKLLVQPWYVLRVAEVPVREYLKTIFRPVIVASICIAAARPFTLRTPGFETLCLGVLWQISLFAFLAFCFLLDADQRRICMAQFRG